MNNKDGFLTKPMVVKAPGYIRKQSAQYFDGHHPGPHWFVCGLFNSSRHKSARESELFCN
jgi:hypothetical protein